MRNSKKALVLIGFVLVFCLGNFLMNLALVEPSYMGINYRVLKEEGPFDILLFGTSHGQSGIVPEKLEQETGMKTMNLCVAGEYAKDSYYMLRHALKYQKPKAIYYELDFTYWLTKPNYQSNTLLREMPWSWNTVQYFFDKMGDQDFRAVFFPWMYTRDVIKNMPVLKNYVYLKIQKAYREKKPESLYAKGAYDNGYIRGGTVPNDQKASYSPHQWNAEYKKMEKHIKEMRSYLKKMIDLCREKGIPFTIFVTPIPEETFRSDAANQKAVDEYFKKLAGEYGVPYYNLNYLRRDLISLSGSEFQDWEGHLGGLAPKFSTLLGKMIREQMAGTWRESDYLDTGKYDA
ncbi:hypothetical protein MUB23_11425 [Cuneatibacter sp. NSJ-177]|uniref:hypothetical protein n=1 Tax=Cuneatibacter sp. NSJ-177 TaxID=2931401 RepID=UPI001FD1C2BA|nr:hypothetical protein [Cuneatibacter sp. NSJ-177]MCJ7835995.1 hypothetical protein [Cuneatibacter sp. NSJ-177]